MQELRLTYTSYIVLGLVELSGEATPYELKQAAAGSVGNFWSMQHAQFYTEPERLAGAGLLTESREEGGRRRKRYRLTKAGAEALEEWRREPTAELGELRNPRAAEALLRGRRPAAGRGAARGPPRAAGPVRVDPKPGLRRWPTGAARHARCGHRPRRRVGGLLGAPGTDHGGLRIARLGSAR